MHHAQLLWSGARISVPLPKRFDNLPHLHAIVSPGTSGRQLCFFPTPRFAPPEALEHLRPEGSIPGAAGQSVDVFIQVEPPEVRWLVWRVDSGTVVVTLNPELVADAPRFASGIVVRSGDDGLPRVEYGANVSGGNARFPYQRDVAMFLAVDGERLETVTISDLGRPGRRESAFEAAPGVAELSTIVDRYKVSWAGVNVGKEVRESDLEAAARGMVIGG